MNQESQTIEKQISLRSEIESDADFLLKLYISVRSEELAFLGWTNEQQTAFCKLQFQLQNQAYKMQFPTAVHSIIEIDGESCGRVLILRGDEEIRLIDISLLPEFRNRGAGKAIIEGLQREAAIAEKPLNLSVLKNNDGAIRLYRKLGFVVSGENQTHYSMQWRGE